MKLRCVFLLLLASVAAHASVTVTVSPTGSSTPTGAYVRVDIINCVNPTVVNSGTTIPLSRQFRLNNQSSVTITLEDNVTQIACNGNQLSYYSFTYIANGVQTPIKSVELPPGIFNLANLANLTTPPWNPGVIQGPTGPVGPPGCYVTDGGCSGVISVNPSGAQVIQQPSGDVFTSSNFRAERDEETFAGDTIAARVNNAVSDCGTTAPCTVIIPAYAPFGVGWTLPLPNNVTMIDQRGYNTQGFAAGQANYLRSYVQYHIYRGADYAFEENELGSGTFDMYLESNAYDGGYVNDGGKANIGSLLVYSTRTNGNRPIWAQDNNVQCSNLNNFCTGIEINMVNQGGGGDSGKFRGLLLTASGADATNDVVGSGLTIQGSHGHWLNAATIQTYAGTGIRMIPGMARVADISFIPPADDANLELIGRNAANSTTVWSIDDSGNINAASFTGSVVNASVGGTIAPVTFGAAPAAGGLGLLWNITGGTGETDFVNNHGVGGGGFNWYNTGTTTPGSPIMNVTSAGQLNIAGPYSSGGTVGFTGTCAPTTTATVKGGIITGCS